MAVSDYCPCARCGAKALYDAEVDYDTPAFGTIAVLCRDCFEQGARLAVVAPPGLER